MRVKLAIETNFQVSTAITVPVISIQNKIVNNVLYKQNLAATSQLKKYWKFKGKKIFLYIRKKACSFYFSTMYFNFMEEENNSDTS